LAGIWASSAERPRAWLARRVHPLRAIGTAVIEIYAFYRRAEAEYNQLQAPLVHDLERLPAHVKAARDATRQAALDSAAAALAARTDD
jgi:hypothetical protein